MCIVSFVQVKKNEFDEAIANSLDVIDCRFPGNVKNVVIKPNMCYYFHYSTGQTTDPAFIGALIDVLRQKIESDAKISIVESDASAMKCKHVFKFLGYNTLAKKHNVNLINLSEEKYEDVNVNVDNCSLQLTIPHIIRNADLRINVPKLKYSPQLGITCAMKNLYGCTSYPKKYKLHAKLVEAIVAINKTIPFDLCLLDGNITRGARTSRLGLVMASQDPVAFDSASARIAGLNPNKIEYLKLAKRERLGTSAYVERGLPLDYFRGWYPKENISLKLKNEALRLFKRTGLRARLGF